MTFTPADSLSLSLFVAFAAAMYVTIIYAVANTSPRKSSTKFVTAFTTALIIFGAIIATGLTQEHPMPAIPIIGAIMIIGTIAFARSGYGTRMATHFSLAALVGFQAFRLPLELILHHWANIGTVPQTMTWTGQNWDIVTGLTALVAIPLANKYRKIALAAQAIGFILLLNVFRVVVMSSPFPFSWQLENPLQLAMHLPYALILPLFVAPALAAHIITLRRLFPLAK